MNAMFGKENVCVIPMEMIQEDFSQFVSKLCQFLEVSEESVGLTGLPKQNKSKYISVLYLTWFLNKFIYKTPTSDCGILDERRRLGGRSRRAARHGLRHLPEIPFSKKISSRHIKVIDKTVGEYFAVINTQASNLIGINLQNYGYKVAP